jgi:hypothetical protein
VESKLRTAGLKINPKAEWKFQVKVIWGFRDKSPMVYIAFRDVDFWGENGQALITESMHSRDRADLLARALGFTAETTDGFLEMWMRAKQEQSKSAINE